MLTETLTSLATSLSFLRLDGSVLASGIVRERERPIGLTKMELYLFLEVGKGSGMWFTTVGARLPAKGDIVDKKSAVLASAGIVTYLSFELCGGVKANCIAEVGRAKQ